MERWLMEPEREPEIKYMEVSETVEGLWRMIQERGNIEQKAGCPTLEALRFPLHAPEYVHDQWEAAMDRLGDLAMELGG